MNEAQKQVLIWGALIFLVCYMLNVNPVSVVTGITHGLQTMHQTNATHK